MGTNTTGAGGNDLSGIANALGLSGPAATAFDNRLKSIAQTVSGSGGAGTKTTITNYNPADLIPLITPIWRKTTGSDATNDQVLAITEAVNAAMKQNPKVATTTGGASAVKNVIPALKPQEVIQEQALKAPGTGDFQAATTYYDALLQAIKGPVGGGF
jgi:hypothetical protein